MDDPLRESRITLFREKGESDPTIVTLRRDNEDAATVYMMARGQVVTAGMGKVVDLNIPAVKIIMDLYGVSNQRDCLGRVLRAFYHIEDKRRVPDGETP